MKLLNAAVLLVCFCVSRAQTPYKFCVTEDKATPTQCNILKKSDSQFNCVYVKDSADCAFKLERGEADFGMFTAEEAILTAKFDTSEERRVVAEIRNSERITEAFKFRTVAIVRGNFTGPLSNLRGKNYCHPGFSQSQVWSDRVLKHFERVLLNRSVVCDKASRSAVEDELAALSSFFSNACRPGKWVPSDFPNLDNRLKKRQFRNLCSLCDSVESCSYNSEADGNQYGTLDCLNKKEGDVAYVSLYYAQLYFGLASPRLQRSSASAGDFKFLCPNGTTQALSTRNPCTWIAQPWDSIIARSDAIANPLREKLQTTLPTEQQPRRANEWIDVFLGIIGRDNILSIRSKAISLREFIQEGREIPEPGTTLPCQRPVRWCTISQEEQEKCDWLRQAGVTQGIVPELQCVRSTSKIGCFEEIRDGRADLVGSDTNLALVGSHYYNLSTAMYEDTEPAYHARVVAVVRNDISAANIQELKNKKACFPEFGGLSWTAVANELRTFSVCPFDNSMAKVFTSVCAPGANRRLPYNTTDDKKLCNLCMEAFSPNQSIWTPYTFSKDESCNASRRNYFYGDVGALRCLATGVAQVAFINAQNLSTYLEDRSLPGFADQYSILCKNGTKISLSKPLDDNCPIIVVNGEEIIARRDRSRAENRDLVITLQEFSDWFGYYSGRYGSIFKMFESFRGVRDLLFREEALDFVTPSEKDEDPFTAIKNYATLKEEAEKCSDAPGGAPGSAVSISVVAFTLLTTALHVLVFF